MKSFSLHRHIINGIKHNQTADSGNDERKEQGKTVKVKRKVYACGRNPWDAPHNGSLAVLNRELRQEINEQQKGDNDDEPARMNAGYFLKEKRHKNGVKERQ